MKRVSMTGTTRVTQTIEVSTNDILSAIWSICGMSDVFAGDMASNGNYWWKREEGKLVEITDISHHGSPQYEPTGREITDPIKLRQYDLLKQLEKLIREQEKQEEEI